MNDKINMAYQFEAIVVDIFRYCGYEIERMEGRCDLRFDFIAKFEQIYYAAEIKYYKNSNIKYNTLLNIVENIMKVQSFDIKTNQSTRQRQEQMVPILITSSILSERYKSQLQRNNIIIIDISNLLFMVQENEELRIKLVSILDFSVDLVGQSEPSIPIKRIGKISKKQYKEYSNIDCGDSQYIAFENACFENLKYLFNEILALWDQQRGSNGSLFRFDLICKIKENIDSEFFNTLKNYFNSKYIVFEFKNYCKPITQKEIFTTERYLYSKALRSVAIIIARKGVDKNGKKAIKGILRENGKLIIVLDDGEMMQMINKKLKNENPSDYLSEKLDELLIGLEK